MTLLSLTAFRRHQAAIGDRRAAHGRRRIPRSMRHALHTHVKRPPHKSARLTASAWFKGRGPLLSRPERVPRARLALAGSRPVRGGSRAPAGGRRGRRCNEWSGTALSGRSYGQSGRGCPVWVGVLAWIDAGSGGRFPPGPPLRPDALPGLEEGGWPRARDCYGLASARPWPPVAGPWPLAGGRPRTVCPQGVVPLVLVSWLGRGHPGTFPERGPRRGAPGMTSFEPCPMFFFWSGPDTAFFGSNPVRPFALGKSRRRRVRPIPPDKCGHALRPALDFSKTVRATGAEKLPATPLS